MNSQPSFWDLANTESSENKRDVLWISGAIDYRVFQLVEERVRDHKRNDAVLLFLTTLGGDPDAAYKVARCLQLKYGTVSVFVHTVCKSAGTLLATGAHELFMSDCAELGPLDVQLRKPEEIDERTSGLAPTQALASLRLSAYNAFETFFIRLRKRTRISSRIAAEVAANLTVGLFSPIYGQLEPLRLGENDRSVKVAEEYVKRLNGTTKNVKDTELADLIAGYPSHGFVIDREEAKKFFNKISLPTQRMIEIAESLNILATRVIFPQSDGDSDSDDTFVLMLNVQVSGDNNAEPATQSNEHQPPGESSQSGGSSGGDTQTGDPTGS